MDFDDNILISNECMDSVCMECGIISSLHCDSEHLYINPHNNTNSDEKNLNNSSNTDNSLNTNTSSNENINNIFGDNTFTIVNKDNITFHLNKNA